jgi:hypothetical protein
MGTDTIVVFLSLGTLLAVAVFALVSKKKIEDRPESEAPKSTLAADGDPHGKPADV